MRSQAQPSPTPHELISSFDAAVVVAGSRGFNDYRLFSETMDAYHAKLEGKKVVYISGAAPSGADALVIQWCKERGHPWSEFHALWGDLQTEPVLVRTRQIKAGGVQRYNALAGFVRNAKMRDYGTHLVTFFDGTSPGTTNMIDLMSKKVEDDKILTILVEVAKEPTPARGVPSARSWWN